jgi:hypothetical protein
MEKINFQDGVTKGNAATFNGMQNNIEAAINEATEIVESKNNTNGYLIKFSDGTMICRQYIDVTEQNAQSHYASKLWTYPTAFIAVPNVIVTVNDWSTYACSCKINPQVASCGIMIHFINPATNQFVDGVASVSVVAIGKWK